MMSVTRWIRLLGIALMLATAGISLFGEALATQQPAPLKIVELKESHGQILSYRYLSGSTDVTMQGTHLARDARIKLKVGSRPGFVELDINRGQISGLKPADQFGRDFLTYVLWAVSVDGKAANLGEITFERDKPISINVTTPYQTFWLMLTAEPDYAVVDPSPVVVLYSVNDNSGRTPSERTALTIPGELFFYTHYADYRRKPGPSESAPNVLLQARKAVELASKSGILGARISREETPEGEEEQRTRDTLKKAKDFLARAENSYKQDPRGSDVVQFSRTAAQIAENARALALGAVGGALVTQLQRELEQLRTAQVTVPPESMALPAAPAAQAANTPAMPMKRPVAARIAAAVSGFVSKPVAWFGAAGWILALLLLFRRRSV